MTAATVKEEHLITAKGPVFIRSYTPAEEPKAQIIVTHGYAEHCDRYRFFADFFAGHGYQVITYDLPGHGLSYGARCYIGDYSQYISILRQVIAHMQEGVMAEKPLFVFGHSMGGLVTTLFLEEATPRNLAAAAVTGPYLGCAIAMPKAAMVFADIMGRIIPHFFIKSTFTGKDVTSNEEIAKEYDSDPKLGHITTFGWFHASNKAQAKVTANGDKIKTPLLCWAGDSDKLASSSVSQKLVEALTVDHQFKLCKDCYHEVLNEVAYRQPGLDAILAWYENHMN